jgi:beta-galactosidase
MTDLSKLHFDSGACEGPCFYRFTMNVPSSGAGRVDDTFLNTHGLGKGVAFLNGQPLGRFWSVGPQFSLYTPGPWLHSGGNDVTVFDLAGRGAREKLGTMEHADYGPAAK